MIFKDFLSMTNKYILDNSRLYTEFSLCFVWVCSTYTIAMTLLTCCWHILIVIPSFLFMTRVLFKQNSYLFHRISKEWNFSFSLNVFYIRCNKSKSSINHYKYLNLLCTYTIWRFRASQEILFVELSDFSGAVSQLLFLTKKWNE